MTKYNGIDTAEQRHRIRSKVFCGLPLTARERSIYLLYIATTQEANEFLKMEKGGKEDGKKD